ncbi:hypothetical protein [Helicobacter pylori]
MKQKKRVGGVLTPNFTPKKGGSWLSDWIKTDRYDYMSHKKALLFTP